MCELEFEKDRVDGEAKRRRDLAYSIADPHCTICGMLAHRTIALAWREDRRCWVARHGN